MPGECVRGLGNGTAALREDGDALGSTAPRARQRVGDLEYLIGTLD